MSSAEAVATPIASVVIPAHNEESVIGACLDALLGQVPPGARLEVVVAANGCTDRTVEIASTYPEVQVLDLDAASKHAALNGGETACTAFPRIYLDADIELGPGALTALVDALSVEAPVAASPHIHFDTTRSSWPVRSFYRAFSRLPYITDGLVGLGVYGVSASGRSRFGQLPAVQADDLFVQRTFAPHERVVTEGTFTVRAPRDLASLVRVRTRVATGNAELAGAMEETTAPSSGDYASSTSSTLRALLHLAVSEPSTFPDLLTYVGVTGVARLRGRRVGTQNWERDSSTR